MNFNGRPVTGASNPQAKLTADQMTRLGLCYGILTLKEAARAFELSESTIRHHWSKLKAMPALPPVTVETT